MSSVVRQKQLAREGFPRQYWRVKDRLCCKSKMCYWRVLQVQDVVSQRGGCPMNDQLSSSCCQWMQRAGSAGALATNVTQVGWPDSCESEAAKAVSSRATETAKIAAGGRRRAARPKGVKS